MVGKILANQQGRKQLIFAGRVCIPAHYFQQIAHKDTAFSRSCLFKGFMDILVTSKPLTHHLMLFYILRNLAHITLQCSALLSVIPGYEIIDQKDPLGSNEIE